MGDIADMMLDGTLCEGCGEYLGADGGYPQRCPVCARALKTEVRTHPYFPSASKVACTVCQRLVKKAGLKDHMRDKHGNAGGSHD